ncbi:hypothetical protein BH09SUM1_BH09SUM1_12790 [soil metagenome]
MTRWIIARLATVCIGSLALFSCSHGDKLKVMERSSQMGDRPVKAFVTNFEDKRGHAAKNHSGISMIPLSPYGAYYVDRHDSNYTSQTEPFPELVAKELVERLKETKVFDQTDYVAPTDPPKLGDYDVEVRGTINMLRAKGGVSRFGLSYIGEMLWDLGPPYLSRRWDVDIDYQLVNAYTGAPIGDKVKAKYTTSRKIFSKYNNRGKTDDLVAKLDPALDPAIDSIWAKTPKPEDAFWASLKSEGREVVAKAENDATNAKLGSPPLFSFLAPANGSTVRDPKTTLRWSITAPGSLKSVTFSVNGAPTSLGIDMMQLAAESTAPKSIPAQDVSIPLGMGKNRIEAIVTDYRGNAPTRAMIELTRLPATLVPVRRFALLIGGASADAKAATNSLKSTLTDPMVGQFEDANVTVVSQDNISGNDLDGALRSFGSKPLSGDLVIIYIQTNGTWEDLKIGDGSTTVDKFITSAKQSLSTSDVILLGDFDFNAAGTGDKLGDRVELPSGWGFVTAEAAGGPSPKKNGYAFAQAIVDALIGRGSSRLTVEKFLDDVVANVQRSGGSGTQSEVYGRFNRSNTMAERE